MLTDLKQTFEAMWLVSHSPVIWFPSLILTIVYLAVLIHDFKKGNNR